MGEFRCSPSAVYNLQAKMPIKKLLFIDTNVWLDFYRARNPFRDDTMKRYMVTCLLVVLFVLGANANVQNKLTDAFHNERLKANSLADFAIAGDGESRLVDGFWVSESKDPAKALTFPQQVKISCTRYNKECMEISVTLGPVKDMVIIQDIDDTIYDVDRWDSHGLTASYGGAGFSRCQRHVLTMDFDSSAVSVSDIPTRKKGCEAFTETNSYRLVRGMYYVDTSPGNNMDKVKK